MKKRILSVLGSLMILGSIFGVSSSDVSASENELKQVDGSYLTTDEKSVGSSENSLSRGKHMMTGECSITKAGTKRVYCYGATTANHEVDRLVVIIYVEQYMEDVDAWGHVDAWVEEATDDFYVATSKSIEVEPGYYYRVHAEHIVWEGDDSPEETYSVTNGIWVS